MDGRDVKRLKAQGQRLDATVHVSDPELKASLVDELVRQLKARQLVKVKLLKGCTDKSARKEVAEALAASTGSHLVEIRGNTVLLYREKGS